jgi:uncharacterized protein
MKKIIIVAGIILLIIAGMFLYLNLRNSSALFGGTHIKVKNQTFIVDLARTDEERQIGLSQTESLDENRGMLFLFEESGEYGFWMRNMKFPIDIIFLQDDTVVTVFESVQPPGEDGNLPVYKPSKPANRVLELNAGKARELELQEGDTIEINV